METISNRKIISLYSLLYKMINHAEKIKENNTLQPRESKRFCNIHMYSTEENMYVDYVIYRRLIDLTLLYFYSLYEWSIHLLWRNLIKYFIKNQNKNDY
jgi:hypothetical protein